MLQGIVPAMITPSKDGKVAVDVLKQYTQWLINHGVDGLFALGTTGEGILLSKSQWESAVRAVTEVGRAHLPIVIQCGGVSLQDTSWRIETALEAGVDGMALMGPYFYAYTESELERYFTLVLEPWPHAKFYLYNIPKYTHNNVSPEVYGRLARRFDNLLGVKDSSGSVESLAAFVQAAPGRTVLSGSDATMQEAHQVGARGIVSGVAAALPTASLAAWKQLEAGQGDGAKRVKSIRDAFHKSSTIRAARALLIAQGLAVGDSFSPLPTLSAELRQQLHTDLRAIGVALDEVVQ